MKKRIILVGLSLMLCMLAGCLEATPLTDEEMDVAAEYAASLLLKYDKHYDTPLYYAEEREERLTPTPTPTLRPTKPTATPKPTVTPKPTATPKPTEAPKATATPKPTATATPEPTEVPVPTVVPTTPTDSGMNMWVICGAACAVIIAAAAIAIVIIFKKSK